MDEEWCKHNASAPGRAKALWEQTLKENIFVVCKTPMAVAITKRTLCGFNTAQVNAQYYPDLIQCLTHSSQDVVSNLCDAKGFWGLNDKKEMKIDAILRSGRLERCAPGKMQRGAAEKWGEATQKRAS